MKWYLESIFALFVYSTIQIVLFVVHIWLLRRAWNSRHRRFPHYVYVVLSIFFTPIPIIFMLIMMLAGRNIYNDIKPNGFIAQMNTPVQQSVIQDLCSWNWIDISKQSCSEDNYSHFEVADIIRDNVNSRPQHEIMNRLSEYRLDCDTRQDGIEYCYGHIDGITYRLVFLDSEIEFHHVNTTRRSS